MITANTTSTVGGVLVVGSITVDLTTFSRRLPAPGETILGDDFTLVLGGKGANQAVASSLAGADTQMVGCVGTDLFQQLTLGTMSERGVDVSAVRIVEGPTGVAHIRVDAGIAAAKGRATVLLTQLETPIDVTSHAIRAGRAAGLTVVLDPAPAAPVEEGLWAAVDIVTPNETEARLLTRIDVVDIDSAMAAGRWFVGRGVRHAVVTLAAQGVVVVDADGARHIAAREVTAVDTTAAGDAFAGHLGAELSRGLCLDEALPRAMAAGALAVTRRGASPSLPDAAAVTAFLQDSQRATDHP